MPHSIGRPQALARVQLERGYKHRDTTHLPCLVCELATDNPLRIHATAHTTVVLTRYPRQWGHLLVLLRRHVTRFSDVTETEWQQVTSDALRAARIVERTLEPARCYVASLGSSRSDLAMTCPHLHMHVVPVSDPDARPADIFSWRDGVYDGTEQEWRALLCTLSTAWQDEL